MLTDAHVHMALPAGELFGMKVIQTPVRIGPARTHSKRRNGGKHSYHLRVQKKWIVRFGMVDRTPMKRGEVLMFGKHTIMVRADDMPHLRRLLRGDSDNG